MQTNNYICVFIFRCLVHYFVVLNIVSVIKILVAMRCFSWEILIYCHRH